MYKLILISFGFLGWAFYEMSGGAEFEPASVRFADQIAIAEQKIEPAPAPKPVEEETVVTAAAETDSFVDTDPPLKPLESEVTRVALNLTTLSNAPEAPSDDTVISGEATDDLGVPRNPGFSVSTEDTPAIIPSLIGQSDVQQVALNTTPGTDVRVVSGNRVNVRSGPSTEFDVVNKLVEGDRVEILEDDGSGWVKLRPVGDGPVGWMAAFLLTEG